MNYLGIDFGERKIGLAKASDEAKVATPFRVVRGGIEDIGQVIKEEGIDSIVVGYPIETTGKIGTQAKKVDSFIKELEVFKKPIHKQDERFSTKSAVAKGDDDASAASLILQTYLDKIS